MTWIRVSAAKCAGPESLVTSTCARSNRWRSSVSVVWPVRSSARGDSDLPANMLGLWLLAGDARNQDEHLGIFQERARELDERLERHPAHGKLLARIGIQNHQLALGADVGVDRAELAPDVRRRTRVGRDLRNSEGVHRPRPFHARHLVRRCFESVDEVEERMRRMNLRVVEHSCVSKSPV